MRPSPIAQGCGACAISSHSTPKRSTSVPKLSAKKVFVGGIIPTQDIDELRRMGVAEVFLPGASTEDVAERIRSSVAAS